MEHEDRSSEVSRERSSWKHVFVSGAKEWHTSERRKEGSGTSDENVVRDADGDAESSNHGSSTPPSTSTSERNLFRMTDTLAEKTFTFAPASTPPCLSPTMPGMIMSRWPSDGARSPTTAGSTRHLYRPASVSSVSFGESPFPGILRKRLEGEFSHGLSQAEFAVRREGKLLLAMVGLPARGKTYIAQSIKRHMDWFGLRTEIFNAGNYRRNVQGARADAGFFDPTNTEGSKMRTLCAELALKDAFESLDSEEKGIYIAILDATNTTKDRRAWVKSMVDQHEGHIRLVCVETVLTDDEKVWENVKQAKLKSPDYRDMSPEAAMEDFMKRIAAYKSVYEPCDQEEELPFIRLTNAGEQLLGFKTQGVLCGRVMQLMGSLRLSLKPILLTRCGESEFEAQGRIGGDSRLTPVGQLYAQALARGVLQGSDRYGTLPVVWTSSRLRARQTAHGLQKTVSVASQKKLHEEGRERSSPPGEGPGAARSANRKHASHLDVLEVSALDEIDAGACDGMTVDDFPKLYPDQYQKRQKDKLNVKFPDGENYRDVFARVESLLLELIAEPQPVIVVAHLAVIRVIYGYLTGVEPSQCPHLKIPMHCVVQLNPKGYGYEEWRHYPLMKGRDDEAIS